MTDDNEARRSQLAAKVEEIEKLIRTGGKTGSFSLAALLDSAQGHLLEQTILDTKSTVEKKEREQRDQQNAIAEAVERETKLNEKEKQEYGALLQKEYFTKSDFGTLDHFYSHSYEKLSDDGKAEMHTRIEEGIRRGEFERSDLPASVRKCESSFKSADHAAASKTGLSGEIDAIKVDESNPQARPQKSYSAQSSEVAPLRDATESNPEKLKQATADAKASVSSESLQGLAMAFDDSTEPSRPAVSTGGSPSKGPAI